MTTSIAPAQDDTPFQALLTFPQQRMRDLLICGFEGGVGYWCQITGFLPKGISDKVHYPHADVPFIPGGIILLKDLEDDKDLRLDRKALERGLCIMAVKYPSHFASFVQENEDAETGDVFIQCCVLGEIVYG